MTIELQVFGLYTCTLQIRYVHGPGKRRGGRGRGGAAALLLVPVRLGQKSKLHDFMVFLVDYILKNIE